MSRSATVARPIDDMLKRWDWFARFIGDGRVCLTNNAAESWLFAGSDRGAERAAAIATLIMTAKLNDVDPQAWLADGLAPPQVILPFDWMSCCRGTGRREHRLFPLRLPDHACQ